MLANRHGLFVHFRWKNAAAVGGDIRIHAEMTGVRAVRGLRSNQGIETPSDVMLWRGGRGNIRSDNGPEFVAKELQNGQGNLRPGALYIEACSPWENGCCESFNGKLRVECLDEEIFYSLKDAQVVIEYLLVDYNTLRTRSPLGCRPPARAAYGPWFHRSRFRSLRR